MPWLNAAAVTFTGTAAFLFSESKSPAAITKVHDKPPRCPQVCEPQGQEQGEVAGEAV